MSQLAPFHRIRLSRGITSWFPLALGWVSAIVAIEIGGRSSPSDVFDSLGVLTLTLLAGLTFARHRESALAQIVANALQRWIGQLRRWKIQIGVDLREDPPLAERPPGVITTALLGTAGVVAIAALLSGSLPGALRETLLTISPTLVCMGLAAIWIVCGIGSLVLFLVPLAILHDRLESVTDPGKSRHWRGESWFVATALAVLAIGSTLAPVWLPFALIALLATLAIAGTCAPGAPSLWFLWRRDQPQAPIFRASWTFLVASNTALFALLLSFIGLLALGDSLVGVPVGSMPITRFLGALFLWTAAGAFGTWCWLIPWSGFLLRYRDPAVTQPLRVFVQGNSTADQRAAATTLRAAGIDAEHRPHALRPTDVTIVLDPTTQVENDDPWTTPSWPLHVAPSELDTPSLHERLQRRGQTVRRRKLYRGLEKLFKLASRRKFEKGEGFWVAPQHWHVTGLTRDVDEDDTWSVGPPYHRVIPLESRSHFYEVMRALELDLIFVEDGIRYRAFRRVLATLFDTYDLHGGRQRAEDKHFVGLTGLRIIIHDFSLERPFQNETYPEPDYEDIARARILHVFRDRGGDTDVDSFPWVDQDQDVPMLVS